MAKYFCFFLGIKNKNSNFPDSYTYRSTTFHYLAKKQNKKTPYSLLVTKTPCYIAYYIYLILDRCLNSNPTQVVCPSVICSRSIRGAPWDSSWSLGAETFLTFCNWSTHGPSSWPWTGDKKKRIIAC